VKYPDRLLVHVVAGVLRDGHGRVLLAQRPPGKHLAGGWEFPGGKLEAGETRFAALSRELQEELGLEVTAARPLMRVQHAYPERDILLDVWIVTRWHGAPAGLDGQALRWCPREELPAAGLLAADAPIVAALMLPERLTIPESGAYVIGEWPQPEQFLRDGRLRGALCGTAAEALAAVAAGADFLVARHVLPDEQLAGLCAAVPAPVFVRGIGLEHAWQLGATGVCD
jgi:mutator protein MutT